MIWSRKLSPRICILINYTKVDTRFRLFSGEIDKNSVTIQGPAVDHALQAQRDAKELIPLPSNIQSLIVSCHILKVLVNLLHFFRK